jgi:transposase-like protein
VAAGGDDGHTNHRAAAARHTAGVDADEEALTAEQQVRALLGEVAELRANEILRTATAFFAQSEFDR